VLYTGPVHIASNNIYNNILPVRAKVSAPGAKRVVEIRIKIRVTEQVFSSVFI
jgi:hypothetical protein